MSDLTLIGTPKARPFRNVWMLEEMQLPYSLLPAFPRSPEVLALNPSGKVPILQHGGFSMTESAAINTYLGDTFRGQIPELVPPVGPKRGRHGWKRQRNAGVAGTRSWCRASRWSWTRRWGL